MASGNEGSLSYENPQTPGLHQVGCYVNGTAQNLWVNFTYSVASEVALSITALTFDSSGLNITVFVNTIWGNCTVTVYEDDAQKATGSEGTLSYLKTIVTGNYSVGVKIDGTADLIWANFTYTVGAEDSLSITALTFGTSGADVTAFATTNWMNTTLTLYENDVQKDTGNEGTTLSYTKATTAGDYSLGLKIDGGGSVIWANYTYSVAVVDLDVDIEDWGVEDVVLEIVGISNLDISWYIYNEGIYSTETGSETGDLGFQFTFAKNTAIGKHNFSIYFNTTDGSQYRWFNRSYTISTVYGTSKIYIYNTQGDYIDFEQFTFLVNGTLIHSNEFYNRTDHVFLLTVQDVFGSELYSATHSWARTIRITIDVYTFIVANQLDSQFIYFNMTRVSGGTWSKHIVPTGFIVFELLYAATYNYEYSTIATDSTVRTATGSVTVSEDTAIIIFEFGLVKILSEIRLISPGGGVGKQYVAEQFASVNATLSMMWTFLWGIGLFLVAMLWIVPYVSKRRRRGEPVMPKPRPRKPKPPGSEMIIPSASKAARKSRKKLGIRQEEDFEYGPRT